MKSSEIHRAGFMTYFDSNTNNDLPLATGNTETRGMAQFEMISYIPLAQR